MIDCEVVERTFLKQLKTLSTIIEVERADLNFETLYGPIHMLQV